MTTLELLNALFTGHLSRNATNIRLAMDQHGITETELNDLIAADLIRVLDFSGQVHYERQVFPCSVATQNTPV